MTAPAETMQPTETLPYPAFRPRRFLSNRHLQTIAGNYLERPEHGLPEAEAELVEVVPAAPNTIPSQVLCHCHWQPAEVRSTRLTVLLLHGLEGSSRSQYILGNAGKLWRSGANVIRMNMRNCGRTEQLTPTLYHSGQSGDVDAVMRFFLHRERLESFALVGYSMGGNLILKLAGELGLNAPKQLHAVVGVSPALDLAQSADALHRGISRLYERKFLRSLTRRYLRKVRLFPGIYNPDLALGIHSMRQFDDIITARYSSFVNADDYYFRAAAARVLDHIAVPTLILHAQDDPFVRITPESRAAIAANTCLHLLEPEHGGHCAFLGKPDPASADDGYWAEATLLRFLLEHA